MTKTQVGHQALCNDCHLAPHRFLLGLLPANTEVPTGPFELSQASSCLNWSLRVPTLPRTRPSLHDRGGGHLLTDTRVLEGSGRESTNGEGSADSCFTNSGRETSAEFLPSHPVWGRCQRSSWAEGGVCVTLHLARLRPNPSCSSRTK
jgi:hypothetical protein